MANKRQPSNEKPVKQVFNYRVNEHIPLIYINGILQTEFNFPFSQHITLKTYPVQRLFRKPNVFIKLTSVRVLNSLSDISKKQ